MAENLVASNLGVAVRRRPDQGYFEFGVVVDGEFYSFGARREGDLDPEFSQGLAKSKQSQDASSESTSSSG